MTEIKIWFPSRLSTSTALRFRDELRGLPAAGSYEIDFSRCKWIEPFSALLASSEIARLKQRIGRTPIRASNFAHMDYAAHIGFFQSFGLAYGKHPGQSEGGPTYQPINLLTSDAIRASADAQGIPIGAVMEQHAEKLAHVLCRQATGNVYDTLAYSMREMMRNVVEHSGADRLAFCAQYWPARQEVEVAIMDWGIGIRTGLLENPKLKVETDHDAIRLALLPGISGKGEKVKKLRVKDSWTNSGFGLYMTSRLCRSGGSFLIGSGDAALLLSGNDMLDMHWGFEGTAIRLQMNVGALQELDAKLEGFRKEASEFRRGCGGADFLSASMASRALARDLR